MKEIDLDRVGITGFTDQAPAIARAISASPGVATGRIAFQPARAKELAADGQPVILVRRDTSTEDVAGFAVSPGSSPPAADALPTPQLWPVSSVKSVWSGAAN